MTANTLKDKWLKKPLRAKITDGLLVFAAMAGMYTFYAYHIESNFQVVIPDRIYRSGQPKEGQLEKWIDEYKLKTVINLRGENNPQYENEKAAADAAGIRMYTLQLSAYRPIKPENLLKLFDILEIAEEPMLIHCRQGIDRAGTVSAIAVWFLGDLPYREAKKEAYVLPGPWKRKKSNDYKHISDLFEAYEAYCEKNGLHPDNKDVFKNWARESLNESNEE